MVMDLHSRGTHSLKEKRHIVSSIKDKLRQKFNISIIESDYQDKWQEIQLAAAMVSNSKVIIEKVFQQVEDLICLNYPVRLVSVNKDYT
jgi:uncharacterized protein YlxP (DUF503 family)